MDFLPYGRQWIDEEDERAVLEVLRSDFLTTGPKVSEFESVLSGVCGGAEAVACSNGTTALHLACIAMGIGPGAAVILPTLTFLATANAVRYCGAEVIFADVDPQTGLMGVREAEEALARAGDKDVKAIFCVHLGGQVCDLEGLSEFAKTRGAYLLADACHAVGGTYQGQGVGAGQYEDVSVFSFHPVKTIAMGEGGAVTTRHKDWAERMRSVRSHGMTPDPETGPWAYRMEELGYNYRVTDMQCALGISQLNKLDGFVKRRQELAKFYDEAFVGLVPVIQTPKRMSGDEPAWHLYALRIDFEALGMSRADLMGALKEQGIGSQVHYIPVHMQPYYTDMYGEQDLSGARAYYEGTLSIPLFPSMSDGDAQRVVQVFKDICAKRMAA